MMVFRLVALALVVLVAAYAADQGRDLAFRIHGLIILLVAGVLFLWELRRSDAPAPVHAGRL